MERYTCDPNKIEKSAQNVMCNVCLSVNRNLSTLGEYQKLFKKLCPAGINAAYKNMVKNQSFLICWECKMLFVNVKIFQQKMFSAQIFFSSLKRRKTTTIRKYNKSLSTLTKSTKINCDYYFTSVIESIGLQSVNNNILDNLIKSKDTQVNQSTKQEECEQIENVNEIDNFEVKIEPKEDLNDPYLDFLKSNENTDFPLNEDEVKVEAQSYDNILDLFEITKNEFPSEDASIKVETQSDDNDFHLLENNENSEFHLEEESVENGVQKDKESAEAKTSSNNDIEKGKPQNIVTRKRNYKPYEMVAIPRPELLGKNIHVFYKKVVMDHCELAQLMEKRKTRRDYLYWRYRCEKCITAFPSEECYNKHFDEKHAEHRGKYECDTCGYRFKQKRTLRAHCMKHLKKYICLLCQRNYYEFNNLRYHYKSIHSKNFKCLKCGHLSETRNQFYAHHRLHILFICDICKKRFTEKKIIERHMRAKHQQAECKICNIKYKRHKFYMNHYLAKHVKEATEESYCVECNVQFDNISLFKRHLKTSVKHNKPEKKSYPCPECNKLFAKRSTAKNHYNYFHKKDTKHRCEPCKRFFLNPYQLRRHKERVHYKLPNRKNKFCKYCGRGFATNRELDNHVRTHTGERPFACERCPSAFTQKQALVSHMRAVHKVINKK